MKKFAHSMTVTLSVTLLTLLFTVSNSAAGEISINIKTVGGLPVTTISAGAPEALVVDLTKGMPKHITLSKGQKVVFAGKWELVSVTAVDSDGKPGHVLSKHCLDPRMVLEAWRFHGVFTAKRCGTAYLSLTWHSLNGPSQSVLIPVTVR